MCHAASQFWHIGNKNLIFITPINDDFVFVHIYSPAK